MSRVWTMRGGILQRSSTAILLAMLISPTSGCVQRRMTIRTNPPGAMVYVDEYPIGVSPISTSFTYYGTRRIRLFKDGYEPLTVMQPMWPPWYEWPPLELFSENLIPGEFRDQRDLCYELKPQAIVPPEQLLARGEQLRRSQPVSPAVVPPAGHPMVLPGPAAPALPGPGAMAPVQPVPEVIPVPQVQPAPQGMVPAQPGAVPGEPVIGGQLPHPLPPP